MTGPTRIPIRLTWNGETQTLAVPDSTQVYLDGELPRIQSIDHHVERSLNQPSDFPPLEKALVPGDQLVIAVEPSIPKIDAVLSGVKHYLDAIDRTPSKVTVLLAEVDADKRTALAKSLAPWNVQVHRSRERQQQAYLAASIEADPIYINRLLVDADFVLPCCLFRPSTTYQASGKYGIAPYFIDADSQNRFARASASRGKHQRSGIAMADEVGEMLGVQLTINVVPSTEGELCGIIAGCPESSRKAAGEIHQANFPPLVDSSYDLVVAVVDGDDSQQTWENTLRAAVAAHRLVEPGGSIVVASRVHEVPADSFAPHVSLDDMQSDCFDSDSHVVASLPDLEMIDRIRQRGPFYLRSLLVRDRVENLGLGFVQSWEEVEHLLQRHPRGVLLGAAQFR